MSLIVDKNNRSSTEIIFEEKLVKEDICKPIVDETIFRGETPVKKSTDLTATNIINEESAEEVTRTAIEVITSERKLTRSESENFNPSSPQSPKKLSPQMRRSFNDLNSTHVTNEILNDQRTSKVESAISNEESKSDKKDIPDSPRSKKYSPKMSRSLNDINLSLYASPKDVSNTQSSFMGEEPPKSLSDHSDNLSKKSTKPMIEKKHQGEIVDKQLSKKPSYDKKLLLSWLSLGERKEVLDSTFLKQVTNLKIATPATAPTYWNKAVSLMLQKITSDLLIKAKKDPNFLIEPKLKRRNSDSKIKTDREKFEEDCLKKMPSVVIKYFLNESIQTTSIIQRISEAFTQLDEHQHFLYLKDFLSITSLSVFFEKYKKLKKDQKSELLVIIGGEVLYNFLEMIFTKNIKERREEWEKIIVSAIQLEFKRLHVLEQEVLITDKAMANHIYPIQLIPAFQVKDSFRSLMSYMFDMYKKRLISDNNESVESKELPKPVPGVLFINGEELTFDFNMHGIKAVELDKDYFLFGTWLIAQLQRAMGISESTTLPFAVQTDLIFNCEIFTNDEKKEVIIFLIEFIKPFFANLKDMISGKGSPFTLLGLFSDVERYNEKQKELINWLENEGMRIWKKMPTNPSLEEMVDLIFSKYQDFKSYDILKEKIPCLLILNSLTINAYSLAEVQLRTIYFPGLAGNVHDSGILQMRTDHEFNPQFYINIDQKLKEFHVRQIRVWNISEFRQQKTHNELTPILCFQPIWLLKSSYEIPSFTGELKLASLNFSHYAQHTLEANRKLNYLTQMIKIKETENKRKSRSWK